MKKREQEGKDTEIRVNNRLVSAKKLKKALGYVDRVGRASEGQSKFDSAPEGPKWHARSQSMSKGEQRPFQTSLSLEPHLQRRSRRSITFICRGFNPRDL